jgi:endonuclease YncB( thermonuclease family)
MQGPTRSVGHDVAVHMSLRVSVAAIGMVVAASAVTSCEINRRESPLAYMDTTTVPDTPVAAVAQLAPPFADSAVTWAVVEVVDGVTLRIDGVGGPAEVRLLGVELPTASDCSNDLAVNGLRFFTRDVEVRLASDQNLVDPSGRLLRHVDTVDGVDVAAEMVRAGFLVAHDPASSIARSGAYTSLEETARVQQRGRWADDACMPAAP